jgi:hypothetical protein
MTKDGYLVERPIVVQPCELGSPFMLTSEDGDDMMMVVIPTELLYENMKLAIS